MKNKALDRGLLIWIEGLGLSERRMNHLCSKAACEKEQICHGSSCDMTMEFLSDPKKERRNRLVHSWTPFLTASCKNEVVLGSNFDALTMYIWWKESLLPRNVKIINFSIFTEKCQSAKKLNQTFFENFPFHVHFLLQIGIIRVPPIRKKNKIGRLTFSRKKGNFKDKFSY